MKRHGVVIAVGCLLCSLHSTARDFDIDFLARAYFESAYLSSGGSLTYTEPVAEQYGVMTAHLWDYGRIKFDAWICSALNDQHDNIHRRAFYVCEDTLMYGYDFEVAKDVSLSTIAGPLWDILGGYKEKQDFPVFWYANQALYNPYVTPYWNALGRMDCGPAKTRIRLGVNHPFKMPWSITLTPFAEVTWGDANRFEANYGERPENDYLLGGALMFTTFGFSAEWYFTDNFFVWGRYRQYILVDSQARNLVADKNTPTAETDYPIFGLGVGCHF